MSECDWQSLLYSLHDRMTECIYEKPLESLSVSLKPEVRFFVLAMLNE